MTTAARTVVPDQPLPRFLAAYAALNADNLDVLDGIYHPQVQFVDPTCRLHGLTELKRHIAALYRNVVECRFEFGDIIDGGTDCCVCWVMHYSHRRLNRGGSISVHGCSMLKFCPTSGTAMLHRDYFDLGELLYEQLPLIAPVVRFVKRRISR